MIHEKITGLIGNAEFFDERAHQVSPGCMEAFGITISSRYGRFDELIELLLFAQAAAEAAVAHYVKEAFYDSQSCTCSFELDRTVILGSEIEMTLRSCAHNTVSQFVWFDQCCGVAIEEDG